MSTSESPQATVTLTKHDTEIPALGETRENWRASLDGLDAVARGRTPERAVKNLIGSVRGDGEEDSLEDRLGAASGSGGEA